MVAGHLQEKKGYYYAVLSYKDADKRRRTKWIASGLPVKGNKKKAEGFLQEQRRSFEIPLADQPIAKDGQELFADYLQRWLQVAKTTVAPTTYGSYGGLLRNPIDPWFRKKRITLQGLTASDLQAFYMEQGRRVKPNSISFQLLQQSAGAKPLAAYPLSRPAPQLRNAAAGAWCAAQTNSGVAGAQRFQHDGQHLCAP